MKKTLITLILALCSTMLNAQVKVLGKIEPNGPTDTYPTHVDSLGRGGFVAVKTWQERNSIPLQRRKAGMMVSVKSTTVDSLYRLDIGLTNADWIPYTATVDVSGKANLTGGNTFTGTQTIDGSIGIGLTSPSSKFHARLGTDKNILFRDNGSNSEIVSVNNAFNDYKPLNFAASEYYFNADIYAGIHSINAANFVGNLTGDLTGTAEKWGPLNFSYINEGTVPTHFLVSENIDDGVIKYSDIGDVKTALGMDDKASLSLDNTFYGMNTFNGVFSNGMCYALDGFLGSSIIFYSAPLSSYGVILDMDTDSPPTQEERIKIPSKSGTVALVSDIPKIFNATDSGDGTTYEFIVSHGLSYTPTMIVVTPNSIAANGRIAAYADSNLIYITYITNTFSPEPPPSGTNNLTWTIMVK